MRNIQSFLGVSFAIGTAISLTACQQVLPSGSDPETPGPVVDALTGFSSTSSRSGLETPGPVVVAQTQFDKSRYLVSQGPKKTRNWVDCQTGMVTTATDDYYGPRLALASGNRDFITEICTNNKLETPFGGKVPPDNQVINKRFVLSNGPEQTKNWVDCQTGVVSTSAPGYYGDALASAQADRDFVSEFCAQNGVSTPLSKYEITKPKYPTPAPTPFRPGKP